MGLLVDQFGVEIEIKAKDSASPAAESISKSFERAKDKIETTRDKIKDFGKECITGALAAVGISLGLREMFNKGMEANLAFEKVKDSLTGVLYLQQGWKDGLTSVQQFNYAVEQSKDVLKELEEVEDRLAMPVEDLAGAYRNVAGVAFTQLGMGKAQVIELTKLASAAGKVGGMGAAGAAQMIMRTIQTGKVFGRAVDPITVKLREAIGTTKKLGQAELYRRIVKGLGEIQPVAEKMSQGFEGSMFRMKDSLEHLYRDLSKPTFIYITDAVDRLRKYLDATAVGGKKNIDVWAEKLVWLVQKIEKVSQFIFNHWKALFALWAGNKALGLFKDITGKSALSMITGKLGFGKGAGGEDSLTTTNVGTMNVGTMNVKGTGGLPGGTSSTSGASEVAKKIWEWKAPILAAIKAALTGTVGTVALGATAVVGAGAAGLAMGHRKMMEEEAIKPLDEAWWKTEALLRKPELVKPVSGEVGYMTPELREAQVAGKIAAGTFGVGTLPREEVEARMTEVLDTLEQTAVFQRGLALNVSGEEMSNASRVGEMNQLVAKKWFEVLNDFKTSQAEMFMTLEKPVAPVDPNVRKKAAPIVNGGIHITQDFKEADPDRVFIRFKNDIENAWEFATQSAGAPGGTI